jgi:hypothetical protein
MAISVAWDNEEKTILRLDFAGKWNWYGYEMAVGEAFGMMESVNHGVDFIFNMQTGEALPEGATFYIKRTLELAPNGYTAIVIAHADASTEATVALFCRIYKKLGDRLAAARTLDKARALFNAPAAPTPKPSVIRLIAAR